MPGLLLILRGSSPVVLQLTEQALDDIDVFISPAIQYGTFLIWNFPFKSMSYIAGSMSLSCVFVLPD
jgi:hypothetical protein